MPEPIRVAIVEDDRPTREGLALLVGGTPGFACVGTFPSVEAALRAEALTPDVFLVDVHLPGVRGSEGVARLCERWPRAEALMLTVYEDDDTVFESICSGACGYLLKKTPPARLLEAIREATEGGAPMSPSVARKVVGLFQKWPPLKTHGLMPQEIRLLSLLAEGHSYQAAAKELHISINTVRNYIRDIYAKLHVHSKSAAIAKALRGRII